MLEETIWINRLAKEANIELETSQALWSSFVSILMQRLLGGDVVSFGSLGVWQVELQREYIAVVNDVRYLCPPSLRLVISSGIQENSIHFEAFTSTLEVDTDIRPELITQWLRAIPRLTEALLEVGHTVLWQGIGILERAEVGASLRLEESFQEGINKPFSAFKVEELNSGITFNDLEVLDRSSLEYLNDHGRLSIPLIATVERVDTAGSELETRELTASQTLGSYAPQELPTRSIEREDRFKRCVPVSKRRKKPMGGVVFLLTVLISSLGGFAWWYLFVKPHRETGMPVSMVKVRPQVAPHLEEPKAVAPQDTLKPDSLKMKASATALDTFKREQEAQAIKTSPQKGNNEAKAIKKGKHLGEYIVVQAGETLQSLSLKKYGHEAFWVYIYEENREHIPNPRKVAIGTKLYLPPAKKYGISLDDTNSLNQALILSRSL